MTNKPVSREQAIQNFAEVFLQGVRERASKTPEQAARDAWYPGHPLGTVEAIAAVIRERREQQQRHALPDAA